MTRRIESSHHPTVELFIDGKSVYESQALRTQVLKNGSLGKRIPDYHWWDNRSTGPVKYSELPHVVASVLLSYNTENAEPLITPATTIAAANIR